MGRLPELEKSEISDRFESGESQCYVRLLLFVKRPRSGDSAGS